MSGLPTDAMYWIKEKDKTTLIHDFETLRSVFVEKCPNFEMLDAMIAAGLRKFILNFNFKRKKGHIEDQNEDTFSRGN